MHKYQLPDIEDIHLVIEDLARENNISMIHILEVAKNAKSEKEIMKRLASIDEEKVDPLVDGIKIRLSDIIQAARDTRHIDQFFTNLIKSSGKILDRLDEFDASVHELVNHVDNDAWSIEKKMYKISSIRRPDNLSKLSHAMFVYYEIYRTQRIRRNAHSILFGSMRRSRWTNAEDIKFDQVTWTKPHKLLYAIEELYDSESDPEGILPFMKLFQKRFPNDIRTAEKGEFKLMPDDEKNEYLFKFLLRAPSEESEKMYSDRISEIYKILDQGSYHERYDYLKTITDLRNMIIYIHPDWSRKFLRDTVLVYHLCNILHLEDYLTKDLKMSWIEVSTTIVDLLQNMVQPLNEK